MHKTENDNSENSQPAVDRSASTSAPSRHSQLTREAANANIGVELPWRRMVVIGDSFAEGLGDPEPSLPGGLRGWADRVAEQLAMLSPDFAYANLAVRGKVIDQILTEQVPAALELQPDIVFISAGGNDVLRPASDPDRISTQMEKIVRQFSAIGATIVLFSAFDVADAAVFKTIRGKAAIYSMNQKVIADNFDAYLVNCWGLKETQDLRYWAADRLHLNPLGHHTVAIAVLDTLHVPHTLAPLTPEPVPQKSWRQARVDDIIWAREYLMPWVVRRIRGVSSGDNIDPKRPEALPVHVQND